MPAAGERAQGVIRENSIRSINGKTVICLIVDVAGESWEVLIWASQAALGMARAGLVRCGFDVDRVDVGVLWENGHYLAGKAAPIIFESYRGKLQARIDLQGPPSAEEMSRLTAALRAVKDHGGDGEGPPPLTDEDVPF